MKPFELVHPKDVAEACRKAAPTTMFKAAGIDVLDRLKERIESPQTLVDLSRLATYAASFTAAGLNPAGREGVLVIVGTLSAFAGAYVATRHLDKITIGAVRYSVATLMLVIGAALAAGVIG